MKWRGKPWGCLTQEFKTSERLLLLYRRGAPNLHPSFSIQISASYPHTVFWLMSQTSLTELVNSKICPDLLFIMVTLRAHACPMATEVTFQPSCNHGAILSSGDLAIQPADHMPHVQRPLCPLWKQTHDSVFAFLTKQFRWGQMYYVSPSSTQIHLWYGIHFGNTSA